MLRPGKVYPFIPNGLFHFNSSDWSISNIRGIWFVFIITTEMSELTANRIDPDQTSRIAASDLGPHCFLMSFSWDAKHKWV